MPDPNEGFPPRYLRTSEAARFLGLSGRTLEKHRTNGGRPGDPQSAAHSRRWRRGPGAVGGAAHVSLSVFRGGLFYRKEVEMLVHLPIVVMATFAPIAVSDTVPRFDVAKECRFEGGSNVEYDRCSQDEDGARQELQKTWTEFVGSDKKTCIASTTIGGFASYVELLVRLQIARDAHDENDRPRSPQATPDVRLRTSGVTVGIGHDPVTPGQTPGRTNH